MIILKSQVSESCSVLFSSLRVYGLYHTVRYSPWNSLGQNIGVGSLSLFQGIFPTQGLNPGLPHCRWILYQLSHRGSPGVSCIADGFFINWAIGEAKLLKSIIELILCKSYVFTKCRKFWKNKCFLLDFIWFDIYRERRLVRKHFAYFKNFELKYSKQIWKKV